mmetsp:Transcript_2614/g.7437  ORF Transcript_2614/g.7437 Transcript_2614/m.7437 type:complete len:324 (-) Transcript_2614:75-1046(-)
MSKIKAGWPSWVSHLKQSKGSESADSPGCRAADGTFLSGAGVGETPRPLENAGVGEIVRAIDPDRIRSGVPGHVSGVGGTGRCTDRCLADSADAADSAREGDLARVGDLGLKPIGILLLFPHKRSVFTEELRAGVRQARFAAGATARTKGRRRRLWCGAPLAVRSSNPQASSFLRRFSTRFLLSLASALSRATSALSRAASACSTKKSSKALQFFSCVQDAGSRSVSSLMMCCWLPPSSRISSGTMFGCCSCDAHAGTGASPRRGARCAGRELAERLSGDKLGGRWKRTRPTISSAFASVRCRPPEGAPEPPRLPRLLAMALT